MGMFQGSATQRPAGPVSSQGGGDLPSKSLLQRRVEQGQRVKGQEQRKQGRVGSCAIQPVPFWEVLGFQDLARVADPIVNTLIHKLVMNPG